jgi:hypothetical protein
MNPHNDIKGLLCIDFTYKADLSNLTYLQHFFFPEIANFKFDLILDANYVTTTSVYKKHSTGVRRFSEFASLINDSNIENWLVVGASWGKCIHQNEIGLRHLKAIPNINFYAANWGIFDDDTGTFATHEQFANDPQVRWERIEQRPYRAFYKLLGAK